jgi:hypothetical protein
MLIPVFTVAENVVLGNEPTNAIGALDLETARAKVREISERFGFNVDPDALVEDLPVGVQQRVEIIKALDAQEKQLTPLVGEVRQTLTAGQDMSASLNTTLVTFDALMKRFGVGEPVSPALNGAPKQAAEPFRIQNYTETAAQLEKTAKQLTELLTALNQTVDPANLAHISAQTAPVFQQAKLGAKEVVDYAFWRSVILMAVGLFALLAYRFLRARIASGKRDTRP